MGFAIKTPTGTFRSWNSNAKDNELLVGEVWVELGEPPVILTPPPPKRLSIESLAAKLVANGILTAQDVIDSNE